MDQVNNYEAEFDAPKIGAAKSLTELKDEFCFYTPALQLMYCPLPEDPLGALAATLGCKIPQFSLQFDEEIFAGLPQPFSHTIFGMRKEVWEIYSNQLRGITAIDRGQGILRQIRLRDLVILDPLERQRKALVSGLVVTVTAICVETNKGCFYIDDTAGIAKPPVFRYTPETFPDFMAQADRLLGQPPKE